MGDRRFRNGDQIMIVRGAEGAELAIPDGWEEILGEPEPIGFLEPRWPIIPTFEDMRKYIPAPIFGPRPHDRFLQGHPSNPRRRK